MFLPVELPLDELASNLGEREVLIAQQRYRKG